MEIRDRQQGQSFAPTILAWCNRIRPNFAALLTLCAVCLIWKALSPIWIPFLGWLFSLFEPAFLFLGMGLLALGGLFMIVIFGFVLAVVGLVLGGGFFRSS